MYVQYQPTFSSFAFRNIKSNGEMNIYSIEDGSVSELSRPPNFLWPACRNGETYISEKLHTGSERRGPSLETANTNSDALQNEVSGIGVGGVGDDFTGNPLGFRSSFQYHRN